MFLEKDPTGNPHMIDKLCTLHLFEADYNLPLKWHSSKGFLSKAENTRWIHDNQGGTWSGHSAIDLVCRSHSMTTAESIKYQQLTSAKMSPNVSKGWSKHAWTCHVANKEQTCLTLNSMWQCNCTCDTMLNMPLVYWPNTINILTVTHGMGPAREQVTHATIG